MEIIADTLNLTPRGGNFLTANWPAPANIKTLITTRNGDVNEGVHRSLNVGLHIGDNLQAALRNREIAQEQVGLSAAYFNQIHSTTVVNVAEALGNTPDADASVDTTGTVTCASVTADCLPVLFYDKTGAVVAIAYAGWRGLAGGVLQNTTAAMRVEPLEVTTCLAFAIDPDAFEVGQDVFDAFCIPVPETADAFEDTDGGKYLAGIYVLMRMVLHREGVDIIYNDTHCTTLERDTLFSYRRDGQTSRVVDLI